MRICVFGAGAVGGHFAVRLARAGHDVSIVARGEHLEAARANGLVLLAGEERILAAVRAAPEAAHLGEQDTVLVTLKSTSLAGLPRAIAPLLGPATTVVFAQNGIPWWYGLDASAGPAPTPDLAWMDPGGDLLALRPRVLGGVIYSANEVVSPGVIRNNSAIQNRLILGELDDAATPRLVALRAALQAAGLGSPDAPAIRASVWSKLVMNMSSSLLAAVTGTPTGELRADPAFETMFQRLHAEACAIAAAHIADFEPPPPMKARAGHTPSILQDYERGRPMEIDGLVTAPLEFARAAGVLTPRLDLLAALLVDKAKRAGLHRPARSLARGIA
jgi:2-dehydropantoate 2-reductase